MTALIRKETFFVFSGNFLYLWNEY